MGMIIAGVVAAFVIAVGASYLVGAQGDDRPAWQVYSTQNVRVGDPGDNLVGPGWTGEGEVTAAELDDDPAS